MYLLHQIFVICDMCNLFIPDDAGLTEEQYIYSGNTPLFERSTSSFWNFLNSIYEGVLLPIYLLITVGEFLLCFWFSSIPFHYQFFSSNFLLPKLYNHFPLLTYIFSWVFFQGPTPSVFLTLMYSRFHTRPSYFIICAVIAFTVSSPPIFSSVSWFISSIYSSFSFIGLNIVLLTSFSILIPHFQFLLSISLSVLLTFSKS